METDDGWPGFAAAAGPAVIALIPVAAAAGLIVAQKVFTFSLRSGEIVRTVGWSASDVLWRTMLRTRLSSRYFGGRPDEVCSGGVVEAGWRVGPVGRADYKRRARVVRHVTKELGVSYPANVRFSEIARVHWHHPAQQVSTVLSARQG